MGWVRPARKGFTLVELLLSSAIMPLVISGVMGVYIMSINTWKESIERFSLQRDSFLAMEKMVRGPEGTGGVVGSSAIECPNSYTLNYTNGANERGYYLSGGNIMYDEDTSAMGTDTVIVDGVNSLIFTAGGGMVTISLSRQGQVGSKTITAALFTQVKIRN